jgi:hypothetical protein
VIAALLLAALSQAPLRGLGYGEEPQRDPAPLLDTRSIASAHFAFEPASAEVGEPVELVLTATHAADERIDVDAAALEDLAWVVLDDPARSTQIHGAEATTKIVWRVARFEPGDTALGEMRVDAVKGIERRVLQFDAGELAVAGVLGENEDAPREAKGFREIVPEIAERPWWPWAVGAGVVLALAAAFFARWLAVRRRPRAVPPPTTLERIELLAKTNVDDAEAVRGMHFELARVMREHFDDVQNARRPALTDEEWLRSVTSGLTPERLGELAALLRSAELVKYGATQPTQWAVRETLERARKIASTGVVETAGVAA